MEYRSSGLGLWYAEISNRLTSHDNGGTICDMISERNSTIDIFNETISTENNFSEFCDDTVNTRTFIDGIYLGIAYTLGYIALSFTIKPVGREIILRKSSIKK